MSAEPAISTTTSAGRPAAAQRSRITNGSALLPGVDGRSAWVRRARDLIREHLADLGGFDNVSAAERSIIRRASVLKGSFFRWRCRFRPGGELSCLRFDCAHSVQAFASAFASALASPRRCSPSTHRPRMPARSRWCRRLQQPQRLALSTRPPPLTALRVHWGISASV